MGTLLERVLAFDAAPAIARGFERGALQAHVRYQAYVGACDILPQPDPRICTCGCGQELRGRQSRWASKECSEFGLVVLYILKGDAQTIRFYLQASRGNCCAHCWVMGEALQVDHIVPVHQGGGGRWLDNYQLLCDGCHKHKTKTERVRAASPITR